MVYPVYGSSAGGVAVDEALVVVVVDAFEVPVDVVVVLAVPLVVVVVAAVPGRHCE